MEEKSEQQKFLADLMGEETNVLDKNLETEVAPEKVETEEEKESKSKNRAFRRLEQKYNQEREAGIALAERVKVLSEVGKFREEVGDDKLKEVEAIFGTDTPEKLAATNILKKALTGMSEMAMEKALAKLEEKQGVDSRLEREAEDEIDLGIEQAEDETGLDLSEGSADREGYLTLVGRLSKKDKYGTIVEYPDFVTAAEVYQRTKQSPSSSRARSIASRSMTPSGESQPSKIESDATWNALRDAGISW
jgi:hypothetical protein